MASTAHPPPPGQRGWTGYTEPRLTADTAALQDNVQQERVGPRSLVKNPSLRA